LRHEDDRPVKSAPRLIAVDLDGTLLDPAGNVSPAVAAAVERAAAAGVTVALATGRRHRSTLEVARHIEVSAYLIIQHGALIKRSDNDATVWSAPLDRSLAMRAADFLLELGFEPLIFVDACQKDLDFYIYGSSEARRAGTLESMAASEGFVGILARSSPPPEDVTEVLALGEKAELETALLKVAERFGTALVLHLLKSPRYEHFFLEAMSPLAGKGKALLELARRLGIGAEETAAVGDDFNDLDMFEAAAVAVAMGNAPEEVRRAADFVVGTNAADGAAEAIDALVAGRF